MGHDNYMAAIHSIFVCRSRVWSIVMPAPTPDQDQVVDVFSGGALEILHRVEVYRLRSDLPANRERGFDM